MNVSNFDLWVLLVSTMRYALGRMSTITAEYPELYARYKGALERHQRLQIAREVEAALERAEDLNTTLGMDMDHQSWTQFAKKVREEES